MTMTFSQSIRHTSARRDAATRERNAGVWEQLRRLIQLDDSKRADDALALAAQLSISPARLAELMDGYGALVAQRKLVADTAGAPAAYEGAKAAHVAAEQKRIREAQGLSIEVPFIADARRLNRISDAECERAHEQRATVKAAGVAKVEAAAKERSAAKAAAAQYASDVERLAMLEREYGCVADAGKVPDFIQ